MILNFIYLLLSKSLPVYKRLPPSSLLGTLPDNGSSSTGAGGPAGTPRSTIPAASCFRSTGKLERLSPHSQQAPPSAAPGGVFSCAGRVAVRRCKKVVSRNIRKKFTPDRFNFGPSKGCFAWHLVVKSLVANAYTLSNRFFLDSSLRYFAYQNWIIDHHAHSFRSVFGITVSL